jgi:hypothetical protein
MTVKSLGDQNKKRYIQTLKGGKSVERPYSYPLIENLTQEYFQVESDVVFILKILDRVRDARVLSGDNSGIFPVEAAACKVRSDKNTLDRRMAKLGIMLGSLDEMKIILNFGKQPNFIRLQDVDV